MGVLVGVSLGGRHGAVGVLNCDISELTGLSLDNVCYVLDLIVNHFLVLDVDQRCKEENAGEDQGQAPEGNELDKTVGNKG